MAAKPRLVWRLMTSAPALEVRMMMVFRKSILRPKLSVTVPSSRIWRRRQHKCVAYLTQENNQRDPARMGCGASSQTAAFASRPNQWAVVHTTTRASTQEEVKDISPIHTDAATSTPQHRQCLVCKNMITPGVKDSVTPGCTLPNWELGDCQAAPTSEHDRVLVTSLN